MADSLPARAMRRMRRTWAKYFFDRTAAGVLKTAPLSVQGDSPVFVSQLCHRDVAAYLLAIALTALLDHWLGRHLARSAKSSPR